MSLSSVFPVFQISWLPLSNTILRVLSSTFHMVVLITEFQPLNCFPSKNKTSQFSIFISESLTKAYYLISNLLWRISQFISATFGLFLFVGGSFSFICQLTTSSSPLKLIKVKFLSKATPETFIELIICIGFLLFYQHVRNAHKYCPAIRISLRRIFLIEEKRTRYLVECNVMEL